MTRLDHRHVFVIFWMFGTVETNEHANGTRASLGTYVNGKREGTWTYWRPDGAPWRTGTIAGGKRVPTLR